MYPRSRLSLFLFCFAVFWSCGTCVGWGVVLYGLINQYRSSSFEGVRATVDSINETTYSTSHAETHGIEISYHYTYKGERYTGDKIRYGQFASSDSWATQMLRDFPVHSHPMAYVDPRNPGEAVLHRGVEGLDYFLVLFLVPFSVAMVGVWWGFCSTMVRRRTPGQFNVVEEGEITRLRPPRLLPVMAGGVALGISAFVSLFPIAFWTSSLQSSMHLIQMVEAGCVAVGFLAAAATLIVRASGRLDITFDGAKRELRAGGQRIAAGDMKSIYLAEGGSSQESLQTYDLFLHYVCNGAPASMRLRGNIADGAAATRLALYLSLRFGVPALRGNDVLKVRAGCDSEALRFRPVRAEELNERC